jgi:hypothetical protein
VSVVGRGGSAVRWVCEPASSACDAVACCTALNTPDVLPTPDHTHRRRLEVQLQDINSQIAELRSKLYARLGDSINLEA